MPWFTLGMVAFLLTEARLRTGAWPQPMRWQDGSPFPTIATTDPAHWRWAYIAVFLGLISSAVFAVAALIPLSSRRLHLQGKSLAGSHRSRLWLGCCLLAVWIGTDPGGTWDWFRD